MEFLKDVLGEELYNKVAEKLEGNDTIKLANIADGKFIPIEKFNQERQTAKTLKTQIDELNGKLGQMQNAVEGSDSLKVQIAQLTSDIAKKDAELRGQRLNYAVLDNARKHKAKDADVVARMIDVSKVTETDEGYSGLAEQFESLAKAYPYMFDATVPNKGGYEPSGTPTGTPQDEFSIMNNMIRQSAGH